MPDKSSTKRHAITALRRRALRNRCKKRRKGARFAPPFRYHRCSTPPPHPSPPRYFLHFTPALASGTHLGVLIISPSSGTEWPMVGAIPTSPEKPMSICCVTLSVPKLCLASADAEESALCCAALNAPRCATSSRVAVID